MKFQLIIEKYLERRTSVSHGYGPKNHFPEQTYVFRQ